MSTSTIMKLACIILLFITVTHTTNVEADITCGEVTQKLAPCLGFLQSGQGPSAGCCRGVMDLKDMAVTTSDRRSACSCMKSAAAAFPSIKLVNTGALPVKCGVSLAVAVTADTDCSKIS